MTEKEKAAAGLLYDANYDPQLIEERARAKDLCLDYNLTRSSQKEERLRLLRSDTCGLPPAEAGKRRVETDSFCADRGAPFHSKLQ